MVRVTHVLVDGLEPPVVAEVVAQHHHHVGGDVPPPRHIQGLERQPQILLGGQREGGKWRRRSVPAIQRPSQAPGLRSDVCPVLRRSLSAPGTGRHTLIGSPSSGPLAPRTRRPPPSTHA
jgi:hypothetical protein